MEQSIPRLKAVRAISFELSETDRAILHRCQPVLNSILDRIAQQKRAEGVRLVQPAPSDSEPSGIDSDLAIQLWMWQAVVERMRSDINVAANIPSSG